MNGRLAASAVRVLLLIAGVPAVAHHSVWAEFDNDRPLEIRGRFIEMDWVNPHSWVHFEVTLSDGSKAIWAAETPPPNQLIRLGWSRNDLKAGDEILVRGFAARNGTRRLWAQNVAIVAQDGRELAEPRTVLALFDPNPDGVPEGLLPGRD
jgi:hypothetical protein